MLGGTASRDRSWRALRRRYSSGASHTPPCTCFVSPSKVSRVAALTSMASSITRASLAQASVPKWRESAQESDRDARGEALINRALREVKQANDKPQLLPLASRGPSLQRVFAVTLALLTTLLLAAPPEVQRDKLRLGADFRWWGRDLQVSAADRPDVGPASVGMSPTGAGIDAQWFPAAYFVDDRGADVGITFRVDMAPGFTTRLGDSRFVSSVTQLRTGLMFRLPFRYAEPSVHAGLHVFEANTSPLASDGRPRPAVPNVSLQGPRVGLGLRLLEFWRITFDVHAGATWLLGLGELASAPFFPGAGGSAFDAKAGLAFRTWPWLDVRIGVDVTVHALSLGAGRTATDAFYGVTLGFVFKGVP